MNKSLFEFGQGFVIEMLKMIKLSNQQLGMASRIIATFSKLKLRSMVRNLHRMCTNQ
jgi:hypothetical protein